MLEFVAKFFNPSPDRSAADQSDCGSRKYFRRVKLIGLDSIQISRLDPSDEAGFRLIVSPTAE